jgi:Ca2+-binding EF-hand superfamily protein
MSIPREEEEKEEEEGRAHKSSARVLSSLWYEYEQEQQGQQGHHYYRQEEEEEEEDAMAVGSSSEDMSAESTETSDSQSTLDPEALLRGADASASNRHPFTSTNETPKPRSSCAHFVAGGGRGGEACSSSGSSSSSGVGILHRSHSQTDDDGGVPGEVNFSCSSGTGDSSRRNLSSMLISHGSILPSRSARPPHTAAAAAAAGSSSPPGSPAPPVPSRGLSPSRSVIDPETLRSLSSIKVKKQTSSMRRRGRASSSSSSSDPAAAPRHSDSDVNGSSRRGPDSGTRRQHHHHHHPPHHYHPHHQQQRSPPPPPPPAPSSVSALTPRTPFTFQPARRNQQRAPVIATTPASAPAASLLPVNDNEEEEEEDEGGEEEGGEQKRMTRSFRKWHCSAEEAANLRLMAEDHFFKRHAFSVLACLRRSVSSSQDDSEGALFFQHKTVDAMLRQWVQRVLCVKEQRDMATFIDDIFLQRLKYKYFSKCKLFYDVENQAKSTLIRHFGSVLRDSINVWQDNILTDLEKRHESPLGKTTSPKDKDKKKSGRPLCHGDTCIIHPDVQVAIAGRGFRRWRYYFAEQCLFLDAHRDGLQHYEAVCGDRFLKCLRRQAVLAAGLSRQAVLADRQFFVTHTSRALANMKQLLQTSREEKRRRAAALPPASAGATSSPSSSPVRPARRSSFSMLKGPAVPLPLPLRPPARLSHAASGSLEPVSEERGEGGEEGRRLPGAPRNNSAAGESQSQSQSQKPPPPKQGRRSRNLSIFSKCFVEENNETDLRVLFNEIDTDSSGTIDFGELYQSTSKSFPSLKLTREDVQSMMEKADLNDDGVIDFDEFRIIMGEAKKHVKTKIATTRRKFNATGKKFSNERGASRSKGTGAQDDVDLGALFNAIDRDGSGTIDTGELYVSMKQSFSDLNLTVEDVQSMMAKADLNDDGVIDFDEFCIIMGDAKKHAEVKSATGGSAKDRTRGGSGGRKMSVFSRNVVDEDDRKEMRNLFNSIDKDKSGTIDTGELYVSMKQSFSDLNLTVEDVQSMMAKADLNDDGVIDFDEFRTIMEQTGSTQSELRAVATGEHNWLAV